MAADPKSITFERPFKYVFSDPNWLSRMLLGGLYLLLSVIVIGGMVVMGYERKLFLALIKDPKAPLPEFDFGADLAAGAPVFAIRLLWGLIGMGLLLVPCVGWAAFIGLIAFIPVAEMRYFTTGNFGAAFEFGAIWDFIKVNFNNVILFVIIGYVAGIAASFGMIACIIGMYFTAFLAQLVRACAMADTWRMAQEGPAAAPKPAAPAAPRPMP